VLRRNRLVESDRRGSLVYYRLAYPQVADLLRVARALLGEILETTQRQLVDRDGLPELPGLPLPTETAPTASAAT
jgi:hypothetical protein